MKNRKLLISRWQLKEKQQLHKFILTESKHLLVNFYKNIVKGELIFRRNAKFFKRMSSEIGRTASQCKSKMQKFEKAAFVDLLKVPADHYAFFVVLRNLKTIQRKNSEKLHIFKNETDFEARQIRVIREIWNESVSFHGKNQLNCAIFYINMKVLNAKI